MTHPLLEPSRHSMIENHAMSDDELCRFLDLGYHVIDSDDIPKSTHDRLFEAAKDIYQRRSELSNPISQHLTPLRTTCTFKFRY